MMNITLSADDKTVARAREVARQQGTSLNALIRDFIERLAGLRSGAATIDELERLWGEGSGDSHGQKIHREEAYEERLGRTRVR